MDRNYQLTALAIGGPLDGELITGQGNAAHAFISPPMKIGFKPFADAIGPTVSEKIAYYRRMEFRYDDKGGEKHLIEFWAADEISDEWDMLLRLARGYHPVVKDLRG